MANGEATPSKNSMLLSWLDGLEGAFWRFAANGLLPAKWFQGQVPVIEERAAKTGHLHVEIVSHCWNYAHLLAYQLSSLVNHPPKSASVTMTVYYAEEDLKTAQTLAYFSEISVPNVVWNWRPIPPGQLFRRSIGRNEAALKTTADWIWFTDCDLMFRHNCLDELVEQLQGKRDALVYPRVEHRTALLNDDDPLLSVEEGHTKLLDVDDSAFEESQNTRATGPLQITHGDAARAAGYCNVIKYYQKPQPVFAKCREDRAFRWLLGTQGVPIDVPGVYRIRHTSKGRYAGSGLRTRIRKWMRREIGP